MNIFDHECTTLDSLGLATQEKKNKTPVSQTSKEILLQYIKTTEKKTTPETRQQFFFTTGICC